MPHNTPTAQFMVQIIRKGIKLILQSESSGAPRRIRTPDPLIRSQVLYPAELPVHIFFIL